MAAVAAAAAAVVAAHPAGAATQYFDPNGSAGLGGTGTWDTTTPAWSNANAATAAPVTFNNGNAAVFTGTAGTVTVGSGGVDASGVTINVSGYTIASGGTLTLDGATPVINFGVASTVTTDTISATIAGTSSLTGVSFTGVSGSTASGSTLAVTGANTYAGTTTLQSSIVQFNTVAMTGTASSFGVSGNVLIGVNGSTVQPTYTGSGGTTDRLFQFDGAGNNQFLLSSGTGAVNFVGTGAAVGGTVGARLINFGGAYTGAANTFAEAIGDLGSGVSITSVTKATAGNQWTLSGANTYTGATTIGSGTLNGVGSHAFGSTSGISVGGAGILGLFADASATFSRTDNTPYPVTVSGSGATINVGNATATGTAAKTIAVGPITVTATAATATINFTGTAGDSSNLSTGAVTGPADATADTVALNNTIAASTGSLTLASYTSSNTGGGETLSFLGGGNYTVTGAITPSTGTGLTVSKTGAGTLALPGSSTYAGGTLLTNGVLSIGQGSSLGTGTLTVTPAGATNGLAQVNATAGLTLSIPIVTSTANLSAFFRSAAPAGATFNVAGPISGAGSVQVQTASQSTVGPIEFSNNASSYTGTFNTGGGAIAFTSVANPGLASALGAGSGPYTLANLTTGLTLQYLGGTSTTTTRALSWTGTTGTLNLDASGAGTVQFLSAAALRSGTGGANTLTFQGANAGGNTLAQVVNDNGGATSVAKAGAGTWVLTGANTYTGSTSVNAGTLVANSSTGSATGTGAVTIGSTTTAGKTTAGVLAGTGTVAGTVAVNAGGLITAGSGATAADSIGTLNTGGQTWNASGGYVAKVSASGAANDQLVMTGLTIASAFGSSFTVTLTGLGGPSSPTTLSTTPVVIATDTAANPGVFQNAINAGLLVLATSNVAGPSGTSLALSEADVGGQELLEVSAATTAAPEPTSLILAAVAAGPLLLGRRRPTRADAAN